MKLFKLLCVSLCLMLASCAQQRAYDEPIRSPNAFGTKQIQPENDPYNE